MIKKVYQKETVLIALSGGIDSSAAALFLKQQGFRVFGLTFKMFDNILSKNSTFPYANSISAINSARKVASILDIPHFTADISQEFQQTVVEDFIEKYSLGQTPNPCVKCNPEIKWHFLEHYAQKFGCTFIASGHYASIREANGRYYISCADDETKDQTAFLWKLSQETLHKIIFPMAEHKKLQIKEFIAKTDLNFLLKKRESFDLCFLKNSDLHSFLRAKYTQIEPGQIFDSAGNNIGTLRDIALYTIGQAVECADGLTRYVSEKHISENSLTAVSQEELSVSEIELCDVHFMKYAEIPENKILTCKIRYRESGTPCRIVKLERNYKIILSEKVRKTAPGQSVVLYEGDDIVCGGIVV
jgi:tRNA-specific 2-thiouridylase